MNDFAFLHGSWNVANRRLTELLAGSDSWEAFPGHAVIRPLFDGSGSIEDTYRGRPVRVHFVWQPLTADSARWERDFSADGGRSWELNRVMELSRDRSQGAS
ncbi:hypothetical protein [Streptomyces sp. NBC_01217]|uniref:hypothetical protein n=1 Tax=Streptomyces sp. NBC_01217 TaxID=2903779 RepID=UPI002E0F75D5|nr:hypothetical protein OG507_25445 [Streptomyces sp. NBC_01217]